MEADSACRHSDFEGPGALPESADPPGCGPAGWTHPQGWGDRARQEHKDKGVSAAWWAKECANPGADSWDSQPQVGKAPLPARTTEDDGRVPREGECVRSCQARDLEPRRRGHGATPWQQSSEHLLGHVGRARTPGLRSWLHWPNFAAVTGKTDAPKPVALDPKRVSSLWGQHPLRSREPAPRARPATRFARPQSRRTKDRWGGKAGGERTASSPSSCVSLGKTQTSLRFVTLEAERLRACGLMS